MARYQVTAPYITVTSAGPYGARLSGYYRDSVLPEDVPQRELDAHEAAGLIVKLDEPAPAPAAEPEPEDDEPPMVFDDPEPVEKPTRDQPKAAWVAYAVARTAGTPGALSEDAANELSKSELVERFGKAE
jgi:hypothetical protein